jgi:phosphoribosylformylglycinamidine synthase
VSKVKGEAGAGMVVVKLGGPAYRIGMGGSAASSMMGGDNKEDLDFNAVQRGDAEMEHKVNRVIRACAEMGEGNPIVAIHDQGAGGNCNVLKEILAPAGGRIDIRAVLSGDTTLSVLELWGAEYQEADALLLHPHAQPLFSALCARECVPVAYVGEVDGSGRVVVYDSSATPGTPAATPVDLDLEAVLGKMPQKTFASTRTPPCAQPFTLPPGATLPAALDRVLTLLAVGSKRFLTNKVDRSVTGLVAQQQCVGPLHTPLADATVLALSHFDTVGIASSIGEQPVKGLTGAHAAHGRLAVAEAILNLGCVGISSLGEAKCSANWMWAAKLPGEGAALYDTARAMADFMIATGVAVDGGKDSLSMAAKVPVAGGGSGSGEGGSGMVTIKAPGTLVISLYAPCPDIRRVLTPDIKTPGASSLLLLSLAPPAHSPPRLGGSALAQVYGQVGAAHEVPDCTNPGALVALFNAVQGLIKGEGGGPRVLSYHDISDGGLVVALLEMAFAGDCGLHLDLTPLEPTAAAIAAAAAAAGAAGAGSAGSAASPHALLFNEDLGVVLEVVEEEEGGGVSGAMALAAHLATLGVHATPLGRTTAEKTITVHSLTHGMLVGPSLPMTTLRDTWESTSFALEARQCNPLCTAQEAGGLRHRGRPAYRAPHTPTPTPPLLLSRPPASKPRVAVVRAEGCNGDREMTAALWGAGLDVWDVHISDLARGLGPPLESFRGCVFPGGFSYADVLDSAKGWAGVIKFNPTLAAAFSAFYARPDTFSLGVCNGAQLSTLLGWAPFGPSTHPPHLQPRFTHNASGRFESRWATVRVQDNTPAVLLKGMGGSVLGVWVSHGEGRAHFPDPALLEQAWSEGCVPLLYTEEGGEVGTEVYPANPNGSPRGIAGLCSKDGRHLAVMPHPERAVYSWQWPWMPQEWRDKAREGGWGVASHWHKMFTNARAFLEGEE